MLIRLPTSPCRTYRPIQRSFVDAWMDSDSPGHAEVLAIVNRSFVQLQEEGGANLPPIRRLDRSPQEELVCEHLRHHLERREVGAGRVRAKQEAARSKRRRRSGVDMKIPAPHYPF